MTSRVSFIHRLSLNLFSNDSIWIFHVLWVLSMKLIYVSNINFQFRILKSQVFYTLQDYSVNKIEFFNASLNIKIWLFIYFFIRIWTKFNNWYEIEIRSDIFWSNSKSKVLRTFLILFASAVENLSAFRSVIRGLGKKRIGNCSTKQESLKNHPLKLNS